MGSEMGNELERNDFQIRSRSLSLLGRTTKTNNTMKAIATRPTPKFSPKPVKRPMKVVLAKSESPAPQSPTAPVRK